MILCTIDTYTKDSSFTTFVYRIGLITTLVLVMFIVIITAFHSQKNHLGDGAVKI